MIDRSVEQHIVEPPFADAMLRLLDLVRGYMTLDEINLVVKAYQLAQESCGGIPGTTSRPIPPLDHALAVTTILAEMMHVDAIGIAAGMVYEAVDAELVLIEQVEYTLGSATARVIESISRLNILERKKQTAATGAMLAIQNNQPSAVKKEREEENSLSNLESKKPRVREAMRRQQMETVRKMFVAMADDPRVVLLKLAYRLHAMRLICGADVYYTETLSEQDIWTMAEESREIYAPLAGRLGISRVESELQDLAFQVLEPDRYNWVCAILDLEAKQWRSYVDRVCDVLRSEMASVGLRAEISGRVKHPYSFYKKIRRNAGDIEDFEQLKDAADISQIHDLLAFRILVDTTTDCYIALGHIHSLWRPKEGRIKDFIANPKPNGYSALHTTIFCLNDQLVEVQIRTHAMHEMAEFGVAMHWHYKDAGDNASASAKELLTWLRQLTEWQQELRGSNTSDADFIDAIKDDLLDEQVFVLTPKGEVKDLPVGSTPLDFAYRIHSNIGDHCSGARIISEVDGDERLVTRMVPLDYELKNGEIVDIVTSRSAHPTRDWLSFARTAAARNKIRRYLKTHERPINIQIGQERLERELKAAGPRGTDAIGEEAEDWVCNEFHMESFEDILAAIGADDLRPRAVVVKLLEFWRLRETKEGKETREARQEEAIPVPTVPAKQTTAKLEVEGVSGLLTRLANCCCPLPEDNIIGFISRGKGVIVHRSDCRNIARLREQDRERLIHVSWSGMTPMRYHAPIIITATDRSGLIRDLATIVSDSGANLMSINSQVSSNHQTVLVMATLEIFDLEQLQHLFFKLEKVKGVIHVARDMGQRK